MGNTLYKLGDDQYALWSSVVEAPTVWGTREQLTGFLIQDALKMAQQLIEERFERADEHGTSSLTKPRTKLMFMQKGTLKVEHLFEFIDSFDAETLTFDESWIEPLGDPDFPDRRVGRAEQKGPWKIEVADASDHG